MKMENLTVDKPADSVLHLNIEKMIFRSMMRSTIPVSVETKYREQVNNIVEEWRRDRHVGYSQKVCQAIIELYNKESQLT